MTPDLSLSPGARVRALLVLAGENETVGWCVRLLGGHSTADDPPLTWLGGRHAAARLRRGGDLDPWPRVWAARALLYAWSPSAEPAVVAALADPAWRVREMAAKVVRLRELGEAADPLVPLVGDPVPRVRVAAVRALAVVGEYEAASAVRTALDDPEPAVRDAAAGALDRLERRLDRPLR